MRYRRVPSARRTPAVVLGLVAIVLTSACARPRPGTSAPSRSVGGSAMQRIAAPSACADGEVVTVSNPTPARVEVVEYNAGWVRSATLGEVLPNARRTFVVDGGAARRYGAGLVRPTGAANAVYQAPYAGGGVGLPAALETQARRIRVERRCNVT